MFPRAPIAMAAGSDLVVKRAVDLESPVSQSVSRSASVPAGSSEVAGAKTGPWMRPTLSCSVPKMDAR